VTKGIRLTPRGRAFLLVSAIMVAIGFTLERPKIFELFSGGSWYIMIIGLAGLLFVYGARLSIITQALTLDSVNIRRLYKDAVIEDSTIDITIEISNDSSNSIYNIEIEDVYPDTMTLINGSNHLVTYIPARGEKKVTYSLKGRMIGKHRFGKMIFTLRDIYGLFFYRVERTSDDIIRIYPKLPEPTGIMASFPGSKTLTGTGYSRRKGSGYEFADLREYIPGDELRRIEWKASSRHRKLMIKEFDAESIANIVIVLDATPSMLYGVVGERKIDYAARTVAFLTKYLTRRRDYLGFIYYDGVLSEVVPLAPADISSPQILRLLANMEVGGAPDKSRLGEVISDGLRRLNIKEKTLYIVISDLEGDIGGLSEVLLKLISMRQEVVVISPYTPLFEIPVLEGRAAFEYKILSIEYWRERDKAVTQLIRNKIPVINVGPLDFIPTIIEKIEDYRRMVM